MVPSFTGHGQRFIWDINRFEGGQEFSIQHLLRGSSRAQEFRLSVVEVCPLDLSSDLCPGTVRCGLCPVLRVCGWSWCL